MALRPAGSCSATERGTRATPRSRRTSANVVAMSALWTLTFGVSPSTAKACSSASLMLALDGQLGVYAAFGGGLDGAEDVATDLGEASTSRDRSRTLPVR